MLPSLVKTAFMISTIVLHCSKRTKSFAFGPSSSSSSPSWLYRHRGFSSSSSSPSSSSSSSSLSSSPSSTNFISVSDAISNFEKTTFIDGSWHLSKDRSAVEEYETGPRIMGAHYFNIDDVATNDAVLNPKKLPHMMPSVELFGRVMDVFSIKSDADDTDTDSTSTSKSKVVIYVTEGCAFGSRAYYTFKSLCHPTNEVYLMQGSLKEWMDGGGPIETDFKEAFSTSKLEDQPTTYGVGGSGSGSGSGGDGNTVTMDEMLSIISNGSSTSSTDDNENDTGDSIVIDARGSARFNAEVPESRPGLRGGHMPGALNVPFTNLLQDDDVTKFKSVDEMKAIFEKAGVDIHSDKRLICTCGSGVTACVLAVGLSECGRDYENTFIYDGSWIEWASDPDTPIV